MYQTKFEDVEQNCTSVLGGMSGVMQLTSKHLFSFATCQIKAAGENKQKASGPT